MLDSSAQ